MNSSFYHFILMFLACFRTRQSCCSQSRSTNSTRDLCVAHQARLRVCYVMDWHAPLSFILLHVRCEDDTTVAIAHVLVVLLSKPLARSCVQ